MEIVLATRNKKKVEEMARILEGMDVVIRTMDDFPSCPEVEEDKDTFEGNAVKKAISIAECTNKPAVADDSGLEVYALNGAPGIMSARYSGENACDVTNIEKLLVEMRDIPDEKRGARFVCCIAFAFPAGNFVTFLGFAEGRIGRETHGRMGFGYDPVFYPSGYKMTFAEMTPGEKDALSHRGKALEKLKDYLVRSLPR
ncbi:MAG TPA: non-canonical purine NTP pyrophosphatase [Nitrospiraceae bacterium]|nr:MAG: non-canonical purine NTP pyrophosphatase, RdgB/HAM1 family [Nitrospirae bacterium GWA2_46_11]HAK89019.1 non-canonical purine NTP pyrophosphatase [Nitrospiraceae bacterium]HCZ11483.1 non-canonical purine NTP pyrophosphatase [Nitrospiraceae bacterium]